MNDSIKPSDFACQAVKSAEAELCSVFARIDEIEAENQLRVLSAFQKEGVSQRHFAPTTGYGYDDTGRDTLDRVFAHALQAEDALVRPQIVNGTHALYLALSALLRPGDTMLSITGKPYDTLLQAIGVAGQNEEGSLYDFGIRYQEIPLLENEIDLPAVLAALKKDNTIRVVYAQRSRGYAWREAFSCAAFQKVFHAIKEIHKDIIIVIDNCYGEFTERLEPCAVGADIIAGSLIKNPGGGLAPTGGYVAGSATFVERIAHRMTVPGMGREVGSYAGSYAPFYQGLFMAPHTTTQSLKSAALFARVFEHRGMVTMPYSTAVRSDIIQAVQFENAESLISFIRSIQRAAPVDSFVTPEPWDMPGYTNQVIMAAGTFVQGASIEMSADAPIREPFIAYLQGALTYAHGRIAAMLALDELRR